MGVKFDGMVLFMLSAVLAGTLTETNTQEHILFIQ